MKTIHSQSTTVRSNVRLKMFFNSLFSFFNSEISFQKKVVSIVLLNQQKETSL